MDFLAALYGTGPPVLHLPESNEILDIDLPVLHLPEKAETGSEERSAAKAWESSDGDNTQEILWYMRLAKWALGRPISPLPPEPNYRRIDR